MIIGVIGKIGSGKTTIVSEHLCNHYGFTQASFAKPFKDALYKYLPKCQRQDLNELREKEKIRKPFTLGVISLSSIFKEYQHSTKQIWDIMQLPLIGKYPLRVRLLYKITRKLIRLGLNPINGLAARLRKMSKLTINDFEYTFTTYRKAMEFIGTEFLRYIDKNIHTMKALSALDPKINYVFDDVRFKNEIDAILSSDDNSIIHVTRDTGKTGQSRHVSNKVIDVPSSYHLDNNSSFENGQKHIDNIMEKINIRLTYYK